LTDGELKALTAILNGALERKEWRVPVLRLVLSSEGTKPR
jgi:hypothetical protein